jgi:hypothetical protein
MSNKEEIEALKKAVKDLAEVIVTLATDMKRKGLTDDERKAIGGDLS